MSKFVFVLILFSVVGYTASAGGTDTLRRAALPDDSFFEQTQRQRFPVFGQFRETYFATGIPTDRTTSKHTADIRFQVSLALRIARTEKLDIIGTFSETGIWNIYDESNPLVETVHNPGLCVWWYLSPQWDVYFCADHMSNGLIGDYSRSVNTLSAAALYTLQERISFGGRIWYGYYEHCPGLPHFFAKRGFGQVWATYRALNNRLNITALINPSHYFRNYNLELNVSYRLSGKGTFLPALFAQYRQGYCETLVNFYKYQSFVRVGLALELKHGLNSSIH